MNLPKKYFNHHKTRLVRTVVVDGYVYYLVLIYHPGTLGNMEEPPEEPTIEITKVLDQGFNDISEEVTLDDYETLTDWLLGDNVDLSQETLHYHG